MAVDQIRRPQIDLQTHLQDPRVEEALRHGDIHKVIEALPSGVTTRDIEDFLKQRFVVLDQALLQNVQIKADAGSLPPPDPVADFLPIQSENTLSEEDQELLARMLGGARAAEIAPEQAAAAGEDIQAYGDELIGMVASHQQERDEFLTHIENAIFDAQLTQDLRAKRDELREELRRIFAMVKAGTIAPEFAIIALAKVQAAERGFLFTILGKQLMHVNQEQSKIAQSFYGEQELGGLEVKKHEIAEKSQSMQQILSTMQKLTQDIDGLISTAKSQVEEYNRTKMELIRRASVSGA